MGGIEDDEPPSKRVKVSSGKSRGLSNNPNLRNQASCLLSDTMARPIESQGNDEVVGSKGVVKKVELVRIIAETLYSLGYTKTGERLEEESGITLHSPVVDLFMQQILDGKWDESVATLNKIGVMDETIIRLASFVILEQKFFELLDSGETMDALTTLRTEITPLDVNEDRIRTLSYSALFSMPNMSIGTSGQESRLKSRKMLLEELQKLLPPSVMIPEKRLVLLVEQALDLQRDACRFHNSSVREMSLLTDHQCGRDQIPSQTMHILREHISEVWFLQFSHNGKYLASSSSDAMVIIWELLADGQIILKHKLSGHEKPVSHVSWSPDGNQILTCGLEESIRRWDSTVGECLHIYEKPGLGLISCGWSPDGKSIFSGVSDKSIIMWDLEGKEIECWKGQRTLRISDLGITTDSKELISVCKETMMLLCGWESKSEKFIEEDQTIISFALSEDSKFLLVSLMNQELHLWNIDGSAKLVAKYKGHKRTRFIVRSCFGGLEQAFIASGSEDSQIYVWHRASGELILTLEGHSGVVNCVSWNPANPHMLASASDDGTIRIWGLNQIHMNDRATHSNSNHHSNGGT